MEGNKEFQWIWSPSRGHSGGLVIGFNNDLLELEDSRSGLYSLSILVRIRTSNFRFWLVNVYGLANHEFSEDFVREISRIYEGEPLPILLGGDFNLIRSDSDRNIGHGDPKLMELFNNFIGNCLLRDIFVSGSQDGS